MLERSGRCLQGDAPESCYCRRPSTARMEQMAQTEPTKQPPQQAERYHAASILPATRHLPDILRLCSYTVRCSRSLPPLLQSPFRIHALAPPAAAPSPADPSRTLERPSRPVSKHQLCKLLLLLGFLLLFALACDMAASIDLRDCDDARPGGGDEGASAPGGPGER